MSRLSTSTPAAAKQPTTTVVVVAPPRDCPVCALSGHPGLVRRPDGSLHLCVHVTSFWADRRVRDEIALIRPVVEDLKSNYQALADFLGVSVGEVQGPPRG